jgi:hypothetical protein
MTKFHYHVGHNMAGYMPESDVYTVSSLQAAQSASLADAKFDLDSAWDGYFGLTPAERKQYGVRKPTKSGSRGDYWLNYDGRADFHYWVSDRCDCQEGQDELSAE